MKATVYKVMMSMMLSACVLSAATVSAQGRSGARGTIGGSRTTTSAPARTSSNDSRQATVSRSAATQTRSTQSTARPAQTVERKNTSTSSSGVRSTNQSLSRMSDRSMDRNVERNVNTGRSSVIRENATSTSTRSSSSVGKTTTTTPSVTRTQDRTVQQQRNVTTGRATLGTDNSRAIDNTRGTVAAERRDATGGKSTGGNNGGNVGNRGGDNKGGNVGGGNTRPGNDRSGHSGNNGGGNTRPDNDRSGHSGHSGDNGGGNVRPGHDKGNHNYNGTGGRRPGDNGNVGTRGTDVKPRVNNKPPRPPKPYSLGPAEHRNQYRWNYMHSNWSRPLPPPVRVYRPAPLRYYRPVIPVHYRPLVGAPIIDRILGITFGTYMDVSLSHLYYNGYDIDGYDNGIVYLRNVAMLNLNWHDVMLNYDDFGRLVNAQFVYSQGYRDLSRYNRVYRDLCAVYGSPIAVNDNLFETAATWFGGNSTGYVTLSFGYQSGRYYTTLSVGN